MSQALPLPIREQIISLRQSGQSLRSIRATLGLDYVTVQRLCARYKLDPVNGLKPRYENCGKKRRGPDDFVYRSVRCFRSWHPGWGAAKFAVSYFAYVLTYHFPVCERFSVGSIGMGRLKSGFKKFPQVNDGQNRFTKAGKSMGRKKSS